jgi:hypothetical protein
MPVLQNGFAAAPVDEAGRTSLARGGCDAPGQIWPQKGKKGARIKPRQAIFAAI